MIANVKAVTKKINGMVLSSSARISMSAALAVHPHIQFVAPIPTVSTRLAHTPVLVTPVSPRTHGLLLLKLALVCQKRVKFIINHTLVCTFNDIEMTCNENRMSMKVPVCLYERHGLVPSEMILGKPWQYVKPECVG